jgi:NADPH:quinone reductase
MRAIQITELSGPDEALALVDIPEPEPSHPATPGRGVLVEVHAAGVSFPEVLQTRGEYQLKPPLPFVPGSEVGGVVRTASAGAAVKPGDRVAAFCMLGGWAEAAVAPEHFCFKLSDELDYGQGAALILNYHTAYFALKLRGRIAAGEWVLVHGAAGGVGTAALDLLRALGVRAIAVVSSDEKARVARAMGAGEVVRSTGDWLAEVRELTEGRGVDVVLDPVGGDRFTDSLRALDQAGRLVVIGFTGGSIPTVKVNRLLLRNLTVLGIGLDPMDQRFPGTVRRIGDAVAALAEDGRIHPLVGRRLPLAEGAEALRVLDRREALGKVVVDVR